MKAIKVLMTITIGVWVIIIISLLTSCKAPRASVKTQTIIKHDTIATREYHTDSVIHNITTNTKDTVFVRENHLTVKYLYKGGDSAYLAGVMAPYKIPHVDTSYIIQKTVVQQVAKPKTPFEWLQYWVTIILLIVVSVKYGAPILMKIFKINLPL